MRAKSTFVLRGPSLYFWLLVSAGAVSPLAEGAETCGLGSLQEGPVGDGVIFAEVGRADTEVSLRYGKSYGTERFEKDRRRSVATSQEVQAAAGFGLGEDFEFHVFANIRSDSFESATRASPVWRETATGGEQEIGAGPVVNFGVLRLGAEASLVLLDKQKFSGQDADGEDVDQTLEASSLPVLRLFAGVKGDRLTVGGRVRLYNDVSTTLSTRAAGDSQEEDAKRRHAGEVGLAAKWQPTASFTLGMDMDYLPNRQALGDRASDSMSLGAGGIYRPEWWFAVAGAFRYSEPSYRELEDASLLADNLGGSRLDVGAIYDTGPARFLAGLGYTIPDVVSFDSDADENAGWKAPGGSSRLEQSTWDVTLSGNFKW